MEPRSTRVLKRGGVEVKKGCEETRSISIYRGVLYTFRPVKIEHETSFRTNLRIQLKKVNHSLIGLGWVRCPHATTVGMCRPSVVSSTAVDEDRFTMVHLYHLE